MKFTKEIKIALVAIVGIVVLFFGLQFLKGLTIFSNDDSYYVTFNDVSGLSPSSPIYANGYKVGVVKDIIYDYSPQGKIVAVMGLDKKMRAAPGFTSRDCQRPAGQHQNQPGARRRPTEHAGFRRHHTRWCRNGHDEPHR